MVSFQTATIDDITSHEDLRTLQIGIRNKQVGLKIALTVNGSTLIAVVQDFRLHYEQDNRRLRRMEALVTVHYNDRQYYVVLMTRKENGTIVWSCKKYEQGLSRLYSEKPWFD